MTNDPPSPIRLIRHDESFEVRYPDGTASVYFYFDDHPGRRAITGRDAPEVALEKAKAFARAETKKAAPLPKE